MGQAAHTAAGNRVQAALAAAENMAQVDLAGPAALVDTREGSWAWSAALRMARRRMASRAALAPGLQRDSWVPGVRASALNMN
jgi:hypothetical protein